MVPVSAPNTMYIIKLCQNQLWRNLAPVNLKLKKLNYLLRVQPKLFIVVAYLTLEIAEQVTKLLDHFFFYFLSNLVAYKKNAFFDTSQSLSFYCFFVAFLFTKKYREHTFYSSKCSFCSKPCKAFFMVKVASIIR